MKDNERNLCQDLLTIANTDSDLKVHGSIMQMSYLYMSDFPFKYFCKLARHAITIRKNVWEKSNDAFSMSIRVQTMKNRISICFLPQYQRQRKCFFRARAEKDIAPHRDASSVVWTLIDNSKLAHDQIARLAAIVVTFSSLSIRPSRKPFTAVCSRQLIKVHLTPKIFFR